MINKNLQQVFGMVAIIVVVFLFSHISLAAESEIRGKAYWGSSLGYVTFNCLDDIVGDHLDVPGNLWSLPAPRGFHFYYEPCVSNPHATYIDEDDNFYGQAWNKTKGLITFDATTTPPDSYSFNSHCSHTCNLSNNCLACYQESDNKIYGWARVESDGTWLKFNNTATTSAMIQSWDLGNPVVPGEDIEPGYFVGYATSSIGDLSLNCITEDSGTCSTRDYSVFIKNLQVGHMSAPNFTYSQACDGTALGATLRWYKKSGQQTAYEIVVNDSDNLSTSTAVCWSGKKYSSLATQYVLPNSDPDCASLDYNKNYYWWIRLYDEDDNPTEWYQYNSNSSSDTDGDPDNNSKTFTTFKHEFPNPFFIHDPEQVLVGQPALFTSTSQVYSSSNPNTAQNCTNGTCNYLWTNSDMFSSISNPTNSTTTMTFFYATSTAVILEVTDSDSYVCSTSTVLNINYDLPLWHEIKAE